MSILTKREAIALHLFKQVVQDMRQDKGPRLEPISVQAAQVAVELTDALLTELNAPLRLKLQHSPELIEKLRKVQGLRDTSTFIVDD